jgi:hypothetical protein
MKTRTFVSLQFTKTRHLICRAQINNVSANLLIDTGASNSCMNSNLREKFQLQIKGNPFDAAGANQEKMQAIMTRKCKLRLGRHDVGKLGFVLLDLTHINKTLSSQGVKPIEGILGADFLKKNKTIIDYRLRKLWL